MRTLYVLLFSCVLLATCLALDPQDKDEDEEDYVEVTDTPDTEGGDSGNEQSKESHEEKVERQGSRAQRRRYRKMKWKQRKTKYSYIDLEQRLQKMEQKIEEISELAKDNKINPRPSKFKQVTNSKFDLESAMEYKKWLLQFPPDLQENYEEAKKLISEHGEYALFHASTVNKEVAELLLLAGANVDLQDPETRDTVLHKELEAKNVQFVELLCKFGANLTIKNAKNVTPAMLVSSSTKSAAALCKRFN